MPRFLWLFVLAITLAAQSGIDRASLDTKCEPCQDFWRYANGGWLDKNPIPPRFSSWGPTSLLRETTQEQLHSILESAAVDTKAASGSNLRKIGDFYAACMNTAAIDALGSKPLAPYLARIDALASAKDLDALFADRDLPSVAPYGLFAITDAKNSKQVILNIAAGGLSLPERDYYFKDDPRSKQIREEFLNHVAKMLQLLGDPAERATAAAQTILAFETKFAEATKTAVERRDPNARYHKMDLAGLSQLTPTFNWKPVLDARKIPQATSINASEPEFLKRFNQQLSAEPVDNWKTWLRWRVLALNATALSKPFVDENFHFRNNILLGIKEPQPRWRNCTVAVDAGLGEALGQVYTDKYFPPESKRRVKELVENLRTTLGIQIRNADWLTPETKKNAMTKLNAFVAKVGYPDKWRDYSSLSIDRASYFNDVRAIGIFARDYNLAKIGKPVDKSEWGMTPPTLNAYYSPLQNEIVFPAGILQPPFFDPKADDAINYGAAGAVIGHEMGHGFDDSGSQYDAEGNLQNWWTPEDRKSFDARAACVIEQFDTLDIGNGLHHKGKLVVGEAMGDLNGLKLAYAAYHRSLEGKPEPPVIDGFTADQRFFLAFARSWGSQMRLEAMQVQVNTNPHPIAKFRCIGTLQNMPEFHKAFHCKPGDPMVRPPDKQCKLW
jgi:predicted metalloendopeptidase